MCRYLRLTALPLFALLASPAPAVAQQKTWEPMISMMPLRADEIVVNAERGSIILRGSIDWPDGRTTTSVMVICQGRSLSMQVRTEKTDDRWGWDVDPDFCKLLVGRVQPRK